MEEPLPAVAPLPSEREGSLLLPLLLLLLLLLPLLLLLIPTSTVATVVVDLPTTPSIPPALPPSLPPSAPTAAAAASAAAVAAAAPINTPFLPFLPPALPSFSLKTILPPVPVNLAALLDKFMISCEKRILSKRTYLREGGREGGTCQAMPPIHSSFLPPSLSPSHSPYLGKDGSSTLSSRRWFLSVITWTKSHSVMK